MKTEEIIERISILKKTHKKIASNCFIQFHNYSERDWEVYASQNSLCIIDMDHGVNRVWFYTVDFDDLKCVVRKGIDEKKEYILDIITKEDTIYQEDIKQMGFCTFTKMMRMSNADISPVLENASILMNYYNPAIGKKAGVEDAAEINQKLWEIFDTRISHLLTIEELKECIKRGEVYIQKDDHADIAAILQRVAEPKRFYINQIYNGMSKEVIHAILLNELIKYHNNGGKYIYAWVEEGNIASRRFHEKYGMVHDGLWDIIYKRGATC